MALRRAEVITSLGNEASLPQRRVASSPSLPVTTQPTQLCAAFEPDERTAVHRTLLVSKDVPRKRIRFNVILCEVYITIARGI